jgi:hypothetical protein
MQISKKKLTAFPQQIQVPLVGFLPFLCPFVFQLSGIIPSDSADNVKRSSL